MKRVLFLPAGIGLAHTGRLIMVAHELRKMGVEVIFGAGSDAIPLLKREKLNFTRILEFSRDVYENKIKRNNFFVYNRRNFLEFVKDELRIYEKIKPDLIVYDTRVSVKVSATISKTPTVSVTNVDATRYYDYEKIGFPVQTTFGRILPPKAVAILRREYGQKYLKRIGKRAIPAVIIAAIIRISPTLLRLGYKPNKDPFQFFMGDLTLVADIPQFRPIKKLPDNVKLIGPIFWDGGEKLPTWKDKISAGMKPLYLSASGTGDRDTFLKILDYLREFGRVVVATTGNTLRPSDVSFKDKSFYITDYLPGSFIMPKAGLIIFPGGNATCYQALSYGVPQICTPFHIDQEDNANQLERLGTGIIINPFKGFDKKTFLKSLDKIFKDGSYRREAVKFKKILARYDGKKTAALEIKKFLKKK